jgi:hypothetical protein
VTTILFQGIFSSEEKVENCQKDSKIDGDSGYSILCHQQEKKNCKTCRTILEVVISTAQQMSFHSTEEDKARNTNQLEQSVAKYLAPAELKQA